MTDPILLSEFKAPAWASHWCARCEWAQTCSDCRPQWTGQGLASARRWLHR